MNDERLRRCIKSPGYNIGHETLINLIGRKQVGPLNRRSGREKASSFILALRLPGQGWPLVGAARPQVPLVPPEAVAWQAKGRAGWCPDRPLRCSPLAAFLKKHALALSVSPEPAAQPGQSPPSSQTVWLHPALGPEGRRAAAAEGRPQAGGFFRPLLAAAHAEGRAKLHCRGSQARCRPLPAAQAPPVSRAWHPAALAC